MADYKKMYITLMDATEKAIRTLIEAQQACEDIFIESEEDEELEKRLENIRLIVNNTKKDEKTDK